MARDPCAAAAPRLRRLQHHLRRTAGAATVGWPTTTGVGVVETAAGCGESHHLRRTTGTADAAGVGPTAVSAAGPGESGDLLDEQRLAQWRAFGFLHIRAAFPPPLLQRILAEARARLDGGGSEAHFTQQFVVESSPMLTRELLEAPRFAGLVRRLLGCDSPSRRVAWCGSFFMTSAPAPNPDGGTYLEQTYHSGKCSSSLGAFEG